ncbi:MAG: hypothetical protein HFK06_06715 [Clostridia bacterium]|nr:hypothetical protein [Clostridia bacterium]
MKAAKFLICCLLAVLIVFLPFRVFGGETGAAATYRYARADAKDVYFCERKDLKYAMFTIPYTYCVDILSSDGEWYYVKYAEDSGLYRALYGYCLAENLTPVETPPENKYLNMTVTVTFKADTPPVGSLPVLGDMTVTAAYYGTYYAGASAYSYVLYDGNFGYVYGANDDYPLNKTDETVDPTPAPAPKEKNSKLVIALALTAVAAAALIILYFASRKSRYFHPDR